ncbi:MAG TPA: glutamate-1-semialdehyde 2,1-aminomutase [Methanoregulaceae archaeon]|nr:glutamate-1-semialdehyde 2,1-aminomutase [Methanoregulaceae archaeon]
MKNSEKLFKTAKTMMPGGVSSPVRAIKPYPFYTASAREAHIRTVDGDDLIDCCLAYGPLILGHAHPEISRAIREQLDKGWLYGTPSPLEPELAGRIIAGFPGMEMVRFVSSGSEATMAAIRVARGYTGKQDIVKIEGGFHGAHDGVLVKAGSGATTLGIPDSAGVLPDVVSHTWQVPYNDADALEDLLSTDNDIAALIIEPVMGNIGPVLPGITYLREVREITKAHDVLLIFDEVITGYRIGIGGAQVYFGVRPDITTLGKIAGGGLPIGIFGGKREIMEFISPQGPVYQAGTFSGNPLSLSAGIATIDWLNTHPEVYSIMRLQAEAIRDAIPPRSGGSFTMLGSMFKYFFRSSPPTNYTEVKQCDTNAFSEFWRKMLSSGIFIPPSQFETNFLSAVHTDDDITRIADAYARALG